VWSVKRHGPCLHAFGPCLIDHRHRGYRVDVRWHFLTHDSIAGVDVGDTLDNEKGLVQRRQCICAANLRRHRLDNRRRDRCTGPRWRSAKLRPIRVHRGRDDAGIPWLDVLHPENGGGGPPLTLPIAGPMKITVQADHVDRSGKVDADKDTGFGDQTALEKHDIIGSSRGSALYRGSKSRRRTERQDRL